MIGKGRPGGMLGPLPRSTLGLMVSALAAFTGCGEGGGGGDAVLVRDSAGVRIVESQDPVWTAEDGSLQRVTLLDSSGNVGSVVRLAPIAKSPSPSSGTLYAPAANPLGAFADASILAGAVPFRMPPPEGVYRDTTFLARYDRAGALADTLGFFPTVDMFSDTSIPFTGSRLFGRTLLVAVSGQRFYVATNEAFEVSVFSNTGELESLVRRDLLPTPLAQEDVQEYHEWRLSRLTSEASRRQVVPMMRGMSYPEVLPPSRQLLVDAQGDIWAEHFALPTHPRSLWSVFDATGQFLGELDLPIGFVVRDIGDDFLLGTWTDSLGVEFVRMYDLNK